MNTITKEMLNRPAGSLVKTTLVDFPGLVACSFFLTGCNLRCPYCYNARLITGIGETEEELSSATKLLEHLNKRKGLIQGLVLSGGEPLLNPLTPYLIQQARSLGYKIKLDTNGTLPEKLKELISDPSTAPDFIAMDIKTAPDRYKDIVAASDNTNISFPEKLKETIKLISEYPSESREFRTVLVPDMVADDDIAKIAALLPEDASWQFAQFQNKNCLNPEYNKKQPYIDSELIELISYAKKFIQGAVLR